MGRATVGLYLEGVGEAADTLSRHPLRASLAGLAVAVAVATTAIVQTGLNGLAETARQTSERAFGSDTFLLTRLATAGLTRRELARRSERNPNLTRSDLRFVEGVADDIVTYAAVTQRQADVVASGRTFENAAVNGTQASLIDIRDIRLDRGRFLTPDEEQRGAPVVVLGRDVVDELFPGVDPLERHVRIGLRRFRVVGLQTAQGTSGGQALDRIVYMPLTAFERTFGVPDSLQIYATERRDRGVQAAEDRARISMRARRHLQPGVDDVFDIVTPEAARSFVDRITGQVGAAGPPISFMALVAAIVVVANTTLVSVTQRTREIGVRRAVGATRRAVIVETLAESTLVAVVGGAVGLVIALGVLAGAGAALEADLTLAWPVAGGSLAAAALSGLVAGWYPARRAASTEVVDALRLD